MVRRTKAVCFELLIFLHHPLTPHSQFLPLHLCGQTPVTWSIIAWHRRANELATKKACSFHPAIWRLNRLTYLAPYPSRNHDSRQEKVNCMMASARSVVQTHKQRLPVAPCTVSGPPYYPSTLPQVSFLQKNISADYIDHVFLATKI